MPRQFSVNSKTVRLEPGKIVDVGIMRVGIFKDCFKTWEVPDQIQNSAATQFLLKFRLGMFTLDRYYFHILYNKSCLELTTKVS